MKSTGSQVVRGLAALALGLLGVTVALSPNLSSAVYTSTSATTGSVSSAADWTPPQVAVVSPGAVVKGQVPVTVQASDGETGVASVTLESMAPGASTWVQLCTTTTAPYTCTWSTVGLAEGTYALRARATDGVGQTTTSEVVRTTVANKLLVVLDRPADEVRGTVPLTASVHNVGSVSHTVRIEYAPADTTTWRSLCTGLTSPYTCSWNTTTLASGDYDLRAVLVAGGTTTYSEVVEEITVDNVAPSITLTNPGSPLSGTRTFTTTATDEHSGVEKVTVQGAVSGSAAWRDVCSTAVEPWSCRVDTRTLADGTWSFRAVAVDAAGNTATSAAVTNRVVDNTISSVSVDADELLGGTVTVTADATSTAGVSSVRIQRAPQGGTTWTDLCTDTTAPYACTWDTTTVADGAYDLRAVLTDGLGRTTTSPVSTGHRVDNSPLRGVDVQTANGGGSPGKVEVDDTVTFTYSSVVDTTKVLAGWNGTSRAVTVRLRDGFLLGRSSKEDGLDVQASGGTVNLGTVNLKQSYVTFLGTVQVNATMTAGTVTVQGVPRTTVTLRMTQVASGGQRLKTVSKSSTMVWSPSAAVTDLQGRPCSTTVVAEGGAPDREF